MSAPTKIRPTRVLFVCLGNICRSPTAEGVFRRLVEAQGLSKLIEIDSAGTGSWHVGSPPDPRAQEEAARRGINISQLRGRSVVANDFDRFDYIVAMDENNYETLDAMCPPRFRDRLYRCAAFAETNPLTEVPDPYYGGAEGFSRVFELLAEAAEGLLEHIKRHRTAA